MKGDELLLMRDQFLCFLYQQGAIAADARVDHRDVVAFLGVDAAEYRVLRSYLREARLVTATGGRWSAGGKSGGHEELWLTPEGVEEASRVVSAIRREAGESSQRRIGFREPGEGED